MDIINNIKYFFLGFFRLYLFGNNGIMFLLYINILYDEMFSFVRRCWIEEWFKEYIYLLYYCFINDFDKFEKV